jgi:excinuclease UvrABC ATPase subunit
MGRKAATPAGEIVAQGLPEEIVRNPKSYRTISETALAEKAKGGRRAAE